MASKSSTGGPDEEERRFPGDTSTNPTGVPSEKPEGDDDITPKQPGSPDD